MSKIEEIALVYHHDDPDGHIAGAILRDYIENDLDMLCITIPKNYNQSFKEWQSVAFFEDAIGEEIDDDTKINLHVFITDLSFTKNTVPYLNVFTEGYMDGGRNVIISVKSFVWIDHHASSGDVIDDIKSCIEHSSIAPSEDDPVENFFYFQNNLCGAALTWIYTDFKASGKLPGKISRVGNDNRITVEVANDFFSTSGKRLYLPDSLVHLDAYDRWTKLDKNANAWLTGLKYNGYKLTKDNPIYIRDRSTLPVLFDSFSISCIDVGEKLLAYQMQTYEEQKSYIRIADIGKYRVAIKNGIGNSWNFCDYLKKRIDDGGCHYAILGAYDPVVSKYRYSVYRNELLDSEDQDLANCRKIAESLGGGGHFGAAGFAIDFSLFDMSPWKLSLFLKENCSDQGVSFGIDPDNVADPCDLIEDPVEKKIYMSGSNSGPDNLSVRGVFKSISFCMPSETLYCDGAFSQKRKDECKYHVYVFYPGDYTIKDIHEMIKDLNDHRYVTKVFMIRDPNLQVDKKDSDKWNWSNSDRDYCYELKEAYPDDVYVCNVPTMYFTLGELFVDVIKEIKGNK